MHDNSMGHLMRNLMDETKKKRYTQKREKVMRKMYGMLPNDKSSLHNPHAFDNQIMELTNTPYKDSEYITKQSSVRSKLISEINNKPTKK